MNKPKNETELLDKIQTAVAEYVCEYEDFDFDFDVSIYVEQGWAKANKLVSKTISGKL